MFARLCVVAAALPLVLGSISIDTPTNVTSGLRSPISYSGQDGDPSFDIQLNHPSFRNSLALDNNVNPTTGSPIDQEWPIVPADSQYTLSATNVSNITQVFFTTGQFAIAAAPVNVSATFSTTFSQTSSASGSSASVTSPSGASTGNPAGTTSSSASSSSGSSGSFNGNGAASLNVGNTGVVAAVLAAVAGATLFL